MTSLIHDGRVVRGYLGVRIEDVNAGLAEEFKLPDTHGALVTEVVPKAPADKAGLKGGDVIVKLNGKKVNDSNHLRLEVADVSPGTKVPIEVVRDGETKKLEVLLQELPGDKAKKDDQEEASNKDTLNGVSVNDIDGRTRREARIPSEVQGVLVTQVEQDSPSYEAGLRPGDVVMEINRKPVSSAEEAVAMTSNVKKLHTLLKVWQRNPQTGEGGIRYIIVDETKNN